MGEPAVRSQKVLVYGRKRGSVAEKLRSAPDRRDEVVGATARTGLRRRSACLATRVERWNCRIAGSRFQERRGLAEMTETGVRDLRDLAPKVRHLSSRVPERPGETRNHVEAAAHGRLASRDDGFRRPRGGAEEAVEGAAGSGRTILDVARRNRVNAVLCAGDLFDDPSPSQDFWEGLTKNIRHSPGPLRRFSGVGQSRSLTQESVKAPEHPFPVCCHPSMYVVDRDDCSFELACGRDAVCAAVRSKAGEHDLAMALPPENLGDARLGIGCVHGWTFDSDGHQTNFPIAPRRRRPHGLDNLAIGDTHSFRDVTEPPRSRRSPGRTRADGFDEPGAGRWRSSQCFGAGGAPRESDGSARGAGPMSAAAISTSCAPCSDRTEARSSRHAPSSRGDGIAVGGERGRTDIPRPAGDRRNPRTRRCSAGGPDGHAVAEAAQARISRRPAAC